MKKLGKRLSSNIASISAFFGAANNCDCVSCGDCGCHNLGHVEAANYATTQTNIFINEAVYYL